MNPQNKNNSKLYVQKFFQQSENEPSSAFEQEPLALIAYTLLILSNLDNIITNTIHTEVVQRHSGCIVLAAMLPRQLN